jgi:TolB-like protein/AraC-like DNA-binding protein
MQDRGSAENDFTRKLTDIIEAHMEDDNFGVSELAHQIGMSRSNLLRKVKKITGLSVSQYIRQIRLARAMELLQEGGYNVSEVSYKVGFNSTSYFIKCFREHYGYPPGETGRGERGGSAPGADEPARSSRPRILIVASAFLLLLLAMFLVLVIKPFASQYEAPEKSIAVLPFKNDSNDSTNLYLINGIMESLLDNLQQIEDLRVVSRTSVEKYRNNPRTIAEIARELNVQYVVEGSGQKIGDQILLHVQLIAASDDQRLWSEQYDREAEDIFSLQAEVSRNIAGEIKAIITPEEEERITRPPTNNMAAYDLFLQGLEYLYQETREGLEKSIPLFKRAIELDREFARAYADLSIAYSLLDWAQVEKKFLNEAELNADMALLYDSRLSQSLVAKAVFHINNREYIEAIPFLEKALEYNPNSATVINLLSDFYTNYLPDADKYLEYALMGIRLDIGAHDSTDASYSFLHLSNALLQAGFIDESLHYVEKSLEYNPQNLYSEYVRGYILFARDGDLERTRDMLVGTLSKAPDRYDILQEVGNVCYYLRDYPCAERYYRRFLEVKDSLNMQVDRGEDAKIGLVYSMMGMEELSDSLFSSYKEYADNDNSMFKHLSLSAYFSYQGDRERALEHLRLFSQQKNFNYLLLPFLRIDPLFDPLMEDPEFQAILGDMEDKATDHHQKVRRILREKNLI